MICEDDYFKSRRGTEAAIEFGNVSKVEITPCGSSRSISSTSTGVFPGGLAAFGAIFLMFGVNGDGPLPLTWSLPWLIKVLKALSR